MTELINISIQTIYHNKILTQDILQQTRTSIHTTSSDNKQQNSKLLKQFELIIKQPNLPFDMVLAIEGNSYGTSIKITLLEKNGNVVKIHSQQSKTYLIQKYISQKNIYNPSIDPLSGAVCFRLGYFQFPITSINKQQWLNKEKLIYDLRLNSKLYRQIQRFNNLLNNGQQLNCQDDNWMSQKYYLPLTKLVARLDQCDMAIKEGNGKGGNMNEGMMKTMMMGDDQHIRQPHTYSNNNNTQQQQTKHFINKLTHYTTQQSPQQQQILNPLHLTKQLKKLQSQSQNLNQLTKRKQGKSNYQSLLINTKTQKILKQLINNMNDRLIMMGNIKIVQGQLGKIVINLERQQQALYIAKRKLLMLLPKNTEYHFLDKYFINDYSVPVSMTLSLKQQSLQSFIHTNLTTMSIKTKLRILVQLCNAIQTLWQQKSIILQVKNMKKIFITKNLTVKIRNLSQYIKIQRHQLLQQKSYVNEKLVDNLLNMVEIYFKLFYTCDVGYMRPSTANMMQRIGGRYGERGESMWGKVMGGRVSQCQQQLPSPIRQTLSSMNYVFLEIINKAQHISVIKMQRMNQREQFVITTSSISQQDDYQYLPIESNNKKNKSLQQQEYDMQIINFKPTCCWLLKNLQLIQHSCM